MFDHDVVIWGWKENKNLVKLCKWKFGQMLGIMHQGPTSGLDSLQP